MIQRSFGWTVTVGALSLLVACSCDEPPEEGDAGCLPDSGMICLRDAGTPEDAGPDEDTGPPAPTQCQSTGRAGGTCRSGSFCGTGLTCEGELTNIMGVPLTIEDAFEIPCAVPNPDDPDGEPVLSDCAVPIGFAPGGLCTQGCAPGTGDTCPTCSTCSNTLGGSDGYGAVGIGVRSFDQEMLTNDTNTGMCRSDCTFDADSRGDCQPGYTCDVGENVCLEGCVADEQCNLGWGIRRHEGLVSIVDGDLTCNTTTGRCDWTPPADAAFGSECDSNADCPADVGVCLIGNRCATYQCNLPDASGTAAMYPCPTGAICVGIGGNEAAFCLDTCTTPEDCFPGQACSPQAGLPGGATGLCFGICENDGECRSDERCRIGGFTDPTIGTCQPSCTPGGTDCEAGEFCEQAEGQTYGFCVELDGFCTADADCVGGQACEVLADDFYGVCVDGCTTEADCASGEACVIQPAGRTCDEDGDCGSGVCTSPTGLTLGTCAASTVGVCRAPGGACSPSPQNAAMETLLPLRGNPQCVPDQTCSATAPEALGTCMGTVTAPLNGGSTGTPDGGVGDAG